MRTLVVMAMLSIGGLASAGGRPQLTGREAPRATDLLRAETLAEKARERLRVPERKSVGWKRGGTGWTSAGPAPAERAAGGGSVTIHVGPGRRARTRVDG